MSKTFNISIPHELGQAEAERRIRAGVDNFKSSFGAVAQVKREAWQGGVLDFDLTAMKQNCQGKVTVLPDKVLMELTLPALLGMLAGKIHEKVVKKGQLLLGGKRS